MKILILSRYDTLGASSRLRLFQYIPRLEKEGYRIVVSPFISNAYIEALNAGKSFSRRKILAFYFRRIWVLLSCCKYDLILVEKEILPWFPSWPERILRLLKIPVVIDIDDATFHRYDRNPSRMVRWLLGKKIARAMHCSSAVIAGNHYLADYARKAKAPIVHYLPTVVDLTRYSSVEGTPCSPLIIGWIGSPTTTPYLKLVGNPIKELASQIPLKVILVGAGDPELEGIPFECKAWREESEVEEVRLFDIGIMPLFDDDWEKGKSGYKMIQYMACGIPVVASPVGINKEILTHGVDGFLAENEGEWLSFLTRLAVDPVLRRQMGAMGRQKVKERYCLEVTSSVFLQIIKANS
ncbi:MAG TPA: glycosyltransferase family 4 protein [Prolixibacteraceae bacterium]|nr:glycosyltransferase family 4 protein [Prolixibacteraceae bacterium]